MSRIIIAVTNDLATDQRVDRTCRALAEEGWRVTLVGRRLHGSPALAPRPYGTRRMRLLFRRSALFYAEYKYPSVFVDAVQPCRRFLCQRY